QFAKGSLNSLAPFAQFFEVITGQNKILFGFYDLIAVIALIGTLADIRLSKASPSREEAFQRTYRQMWKLNFVLSCTFLPILFMMLYDIFNHSHVSVIDRYSVLIAPGMYFIFACLLYGLIRGRISKIAIPTLVLMLLLAIANVWAPSPLRDEHNKKDI